MLSLRTRKFIGILLTLAYITLYALVIMAVGSLFVLGRGPVIELIFYVLAGFGWLPIEMAIIRWMSKPDPAR